MKISALTTFALFASTTASFADWQSTHWGMDKSAVEKSYPTTAVDAQEAKSAGTFNDIGEIELRTPIKADGFEFDTYFGFDSNLKLVSVDLHVSSGSCYPIRDQLVAKYGAPIRNDPLGAGSYIVEWQTKADRVREMFVDQDTCSITYTKRGTSLPL